MTDSHIHSTLSWYESEARGILEKHAPSELEEFDREGTSLKELASREIDAFPVCFLGNSGVGKSTLINALVGGVENVVPSGGIGPLTAQALTVKYGVIRRLRVEYHPPGMYWRLLFALERQLSRDLGTPADSPPDEDEVDADEQLEVSAALEVEEGEEPIIRKLVKQARLLVKGNQDCEVELTYLVDCLREAGGKPRKYGSVLVESDRPNLIAIGGALSNAKEKRPAHFAASDGAAEFRERMKEHASGFMAPLIKELTVEWDGSHLSEGLTLVDLPGVGIAGDLHRDVTRKWIRERARAVVVVVDHRGVTEAVAELLRKTEFLNRLLYSSDDPISDPVLVVAITKLDDIAQSRYEDTRVTNPSIKRAQHFREACAESVDRTRVQIRETVMAAWSNQGEPLDETKLQVLDNILSTMQVHPVSAVHFRKLIVEDEDDRSFLASIRDTGIPTMLTSLRDLATAKIRQTQLATEAAASSFLQRLAARIQLIEQQWTEQTRAADEAAKLREDLGRFLEPLRREYAVRLGEYRNFLRRTIPERIGDLVAHSAEKSRNEIRKYLIGLGAAHWGTLRASVRRGGKYSGARDVDLPHEFAMRFEEPIAAVWSKKILQDIRAETRRFACASVEYIESVVEWAKGEGARVRPQLVMALLDKVKEDAAQLESVGRDMIADLRDEARSQLISAIEPPIKRGCKAFVDRHADVGAGVKHRILQLFEDLSEQVIEFATEPATNILTKLFKEVEQQIVRTLRKHDDPLEEAANSIVASQEESMRRSDARRRAEVLSCLERARTAMPIRLQERAGAS